MQQYDEQFNANMFMALDHGIDCVEDLKGPMVPFAMIIGLDGKRKIHRFVCDTFEESVDKAKKFIDDNKLSMSIYSIVYDGYVTINDEKYDAIMCETGCSKISKGLLMAQRYKKSGWFKRKINHLVIRHY